MTVTPDEGGPLQPEALVVRPGPIDLVQLEAQALELRGLPGDEAGVGLLERSVAGDVLGVVVEKPAREAAREEALEVRVAAVATEATRPAARREEVLVVPVPPSRRRFLIEEPLLG
jgi:hypothetical protein